MLAIRRFTGWHMTGILVAFFGVVIAVNVYMAHLATSTFTGEVVENGYVASQQYNHWLDEAAKERALGWSATVARQVDGRLVVQLKGNGTEGAALSAEAWRPLVANTTRQIAFVRMKDGTFISDQRLADGRWDMRLTVLAAGKRWRSMETI